MLNETANLKTLELGYHLINNQMIVQLKKKVLLYFLMGWNIAPIEYEDLPYTVFPLKVSSINSTSDLELKLITLLLSFK